MGYSVKPVVPIEYVYNRYGHFRDFLIFVCVHIYTSIQTLLSLRYTNTSTHHYIYIYIYTRTHGTRGV
jgi:hypothetical protein